MTKYFLEEDRGTVLLSPETEPEEQSAETTVDEAEPENTEDKGFKELTDDYGNALTETTFTDGEFGTIYRAFIQDRGTVLLSPNKTS